jgi:hypothetical protein
MKHLSFNNLAFAVVISFMAGGWITHTYFDAVAKTNPLQPKTGIGTKGAVSRMVDANLELQQRPGATPITISNPPPANPAENVLASDPQALAGLIEKYNNESDPSKRARMRMHLLSAPPEVRTEFAAKLIASNDTEQRREAFELLQDQNSNTGRGRDLIKTALITEMDPQVLSTVISSAAEPWLAPPQEKNDIVNQLKVFTDHEDARVRAQSVLALSKWDHGDSTETYLLKGLSDPDVIVKLSALTSAEDRNIQSDEFRAALLSEVSNSEGDNMVRLAAADVLRRFNLNEQESFQVAKTQQELQKPN